MSETVLLINRLTRLCFNWQPASVKMRLMQRWQTQTLHGLGRGMNDTMSYEDQSWAGIWSVYSQTLDLLSVPYFMLAAKSWAGLELIILSHMLSDFHYVTEYGKTREDRHHLMIAIIIQFWGHEKMPAFLGHISQLFRKSKIFKYEILLFINVKSN